MYSSIDGIGSVSANRPEPIAQALFVGRRTSDPSTTSSSSPTSSSGGRKRNLNQLIQAIDDERLGAPDPETKLKILKWLSFTSEFDPLVSSRRCFDVHSHFPPVV